MSSNKKAVGYTSLLGLVLAVFVVWITYQQETIGKESTPAPTAEVVTPTPTEEAVKIEFVEGVPTAVAFTATPTVTHTPTPAPTVTPTEIPPTPTRTPTEGVKQAKPTNTPTPTKKPVKTQNIVPYPTGKVGTQYTDSTEKHTWKPYARYQAITAKGSKELKLQKIARTAENGIRIVTDPNGVDRYCVALAPQWAGGTSVDIGRCIDIKMANGAVLHCVLGDCKKHEHTQNKEGRYGGHGELIEFQVDMDMLPEQARKRGDISYVSSEFEGGIVSVTVLDLYIKGFGR